MSNFEAVRCNNYMMLLEVQSVNNIDLINGLEFLVLCLIEQALTRFLVDVYKTPGNSYMLFEVLVARI